MSSVRLAEPSFTTPAATQGSRVNLHVVFSDWNETRRTLQAASALAHDLDARITLHAAQVVPYPIALDQSPVSRSFVERTLRDLAAESEIETSVRLYFCRDRTGTIRGVLTPGSIVVLARRRWWWPGWQNILAWRLRRDGHHVLFVKRTGLPQAGAACLAPTAEESTF